MSNESQRVTAGMLCLGETGRGGSHILEGKAALFKESLLALSSVQAVFSRPSSLSHSVTVTSHRGLAPHYVFS